MTAEKWATGTGYGGERSDVNSRQDDKRRRRKDNESSKEESAGKNGSPAEHKRSHNITSGADSSDVRDRQGVSGGKESNTRK